MNRKLVVLLGMLALASCGPPPLRVDPLTTIDLQRAQRYCRGGDQWACSQVPQRLAKAQAEYNGQPWDSEDPRHPWGIGGGTYVYMPHYRRYMADSTAGFTGVPPRSGGHRN